MMTDIATETFGPLWQYRSTPILGLTGKRGVGKSEVTKMLVARGFVRAHAFDGGKAASAAYFRHLGADEGSAASMINGSLKDEPCGLLPGRATPRYFMERFGKFMGTAMGPEWTLGAELDRLARDHPDTPVVAESVVYEADCLRERGGILVRVERPGHEGPAGIETDRVQETLDPDFIILNSGDLEALETTVDNLLARIA